MLDAKPGDRVTYTYGAQVRSGRVHSVCAGHLRLRGHAGMPETVPLRRVLAVIP